MQLNPEWPSDTKFKTAAVRHLYWLCHTRQLTDSERRFDPGKYLPHNLADILERWDRNPGGGPVVLTEAPHRRLGLYVEQLYECLIQDILGWQVLARNLQIRNEGTTLGELDIVVRNAHTGHIEHHELAVKFYLGYQDSDCSPLWYGPNSRDRLDIKTRRLLEHQSRLTERLETLEALAQKGIRGPIEPKVFMPGYLFYPEGVSLTTPSGVPRDHAKGKWIYHSELSRITTSSWVPLVKPHWLGPWQQLHTPDPQLTRDALDDVERTGTPRLFAAMAKDPQTDGWQEAERIFVVPGEWPQVNRVARPVE